MRGTHLSQVIKSQNKIIYHVLLQREIQSHALLRRESQ
jgi:hypothetical protein